MPEEKRPNKQEYYLGIAEAVGKRSTCLRRKIGAIIVVKDAIITTGYNGSARGVVNCLEIGCAKDAKNIPRYGSYDVCPAVHAEENCIVNAARNGVSVYQGTLYIIGKMPNGTATPSHPCDRCRRILMNAGVEKVVTKTEDGKIIEYKVEDWVKEDTEKQKKIIQDSLDAKEKN